MVSGFEQLLAEVLEREGGEVKASEVFSLNTRVRKSLGDKKLVDSAVNSEYFDVGTAHNGEITIVLISSPLVSSPPKKTVRKEISVAKRKADTFKCRYCGKEFLSRNSMFRHIREGQNDGKECYHRAVAEGMPTKRKAIGTHVGKSLYEQVVLVLMRKGPSMRLNWLVTQRQIKSALRIFIHKCSFDNIPRDSRCKYESPGWWLLAARVLACFLLKCSDEFTVTGLEKALVSSFHDVPPSAIGAVDVTLLHVEKRQSLQKELTSAGRKSKTLNFPEVVKGKEYKLLTLKPEIAVLSKTSGVRTENLIMQLRTDEAVLALTATIEKEENRIESVSRLDQGTSGVMVIPLTVKSGNYLTSLFKERKVFKMYIALVYGSVQGAGTIDAKLLHVNSVRTTFVSSKGKQALTDYRPLQTFTYEGEPFSLVAVKPLTGRTHQIRAHMAHIGHALVGDRKYEAKKCVKVSWCNRLFLHSYFIRASNAEGETFESIADIPDELVQVISLLNHGESNDLPSLLEPLTLNFYN